MVDYRGRIVLREASSIFPRPLPTEYAFLEHGQPLNHKISVRHPHNNDVLLTLFAWDHKDGALHFGLLHTACAIIADNRHDGYLSASRHHQAERLILDHDELVPYQTYYFHVPDVPHYPVVPTFDDWRFPNSLPSAWLPMATDDDTAAQATTQSNFSAGVKMRDRTCRLSNHSSATETAHLCPEKAEAWYLRNDMQVWNQSQIPNNVNMTRDVANCLLLSSNLHKTFDDRVWVFYPKASGTPVAHFLQAAPDQAALYHNTIAHLLQCDSHFLYARFAWAIFPLLSPYLTKPTARKVKIWNAPKNDWKEETIHGQQLRQRVHPSPSTSPTKRSRPLEHVHVESEHVVTAKRHKSSSSVDDESSLGSTAIGPSLTGDDDDYNHHVHLCTSTALSVEQLEEEEDFALMRRRFPKLGDMSAQQEPASWYPGWRRVARIKDKWIADDRERASKSSNLLPAVVDTDYSVDAIEAVTRKVDDYDDSDDV